MPEWLYGPIPGIAEPSVAPEFSVTHLGGIELLGNLARAYYCTDQLPLEARGLPPQRIVQCKIIWPVRVLPVAMGAWGQCFAALSGPRRINLGPFPHLVKD